MGHFVLPRFAKPARWLFLLIATTALLAIASAGKAHAYNPTPIGNEAPLPNSADIVRGGSGPVQPFFTVGIAPATAGYDGRMSWAKVYVPIGQPAHLIVKYGGGNCYFDYGTNADVVYRLYSLTNNENAAPQVPGETLGPNPSDDSTGSLNKPCNDQAVFFNIGPNDGIASRIPGHEGYRVFGFRAVILGGTPVSAGRQLGKSYILSINNGLVGVSRPIQNAESLTYFGLLNQKIDHDSTGENWDYSLQFAPRCNENNTSSPFSVYDADWGVYNQPNLAVDIKGDPKGTVPAVWGTTYLDKRGVNGDFGNGSGTAQTWPYNAQDVTQYRMYWHDINWSNAIQVRIEYDQFDAQPSIICHKAQCVATITSPPPYNTGVPINVQIIVTNTGLIPFNSGDRLQERQTSPPGPTRTFPVTAAPPGGTATVSAQVTRGSPGTYTLQYQMTRTAASTPYGTSCSITFSMTSVPVVITETKPFVKMYGAPAITGGWFNKDNNACGPGVGSGTANYQQASSSGLNPYPGGIRTFGAVENSGGTNHEFGSVSKYGSLSLGLVEGTTSSTRTTGTGFGFFTSQLHSTPAAGFPANQGAFFSPTYLSNANGTPPPTAFYPPTTHYSGASGKFLGGIIGGTTAGYNQCIPDYYGTTQSNPITQPPGTVSNLQTYRSVPFAPRTQLRFTTVGNQPIVLGGGTPLVVSVGQQLTMYVEGDVFIANNIVYEGGYNFTDPNSVPYFSLIVKGNIFVGNTVDLIEGFYVAQPDLDDPGDQARINTTGQFYSCATRTPARTVSPDRIPYDCNSRLLINGAVAAKRAVLSRSNGSLENARDNENFCAGVLYPANQNENVCGGSSFVRNSQNGFPGGTFRAGDTAGEVFNFIPEMFIGIPNFAGGGGLLSSFDIERIYSLPAVF